MQSPFNMHLLEFFTPVSVVTAIFVLLLTTVYMLLKNRNILPGPRGLPYLGLFPYLQDETCHLQLQEFGRKYGDVYSFTFCGNLIINLGSAKAMRELHVNKSDCFQGRFEKFNLLKFIMPEGVSMVNGESWKVQRKYFQQAFKTYGIAGMRDHLAGPIYDSLALTIADLKERNGNSFNVIDSLIIRCTELMQKVLFGEDGVSDERLQGMNNAYAVSLERMTGVNLLLIGPLGKLLFHTLPVHRRALKEHEVLRDLLRKTIKEIESNMDENHATCVIEDYFKTRNERREKNDPTWKYFTDTALISSLSQFVGDGILSVAYYIGCFLYALVKHPEEQDKVYKEVMDVIGPSRLTSNEDRSKLPYTNAFMNEVTRTSNFFPLFPSMECSKETTIRGYRIPKGSITMLNIWQSHHDPATYEDPDKFDPTRYLTIPGKSRAELPVLFGMGKRSCSGEPFVMLQAFLFLTSIVKNFTISEPPNSQSKSENFLMTGHMELCIVPREEK